jgi:hypothetical protein
LTFLTHPRSFAQKIIVKKLLLILLPVILMTLACTKQNGTANGDPDGPRIHTLIINSDTLHIIGQFGPAPNTGLRRVIINDETLPEEDVVSWEETEIAVKVEKKEPEEKKVQVEVDKKKSNVKIINIPTIPVSQAVKMDFLVVEEFSSYLYIYGSFGPDPGEERRSIAVLTFTDYESYTKITNVVLWSPNLIICQIPSEGNGSKGKVIVRVDNDSAVRPLYEYNGVLNYVRPQGGVNGSLAEKIKFHIRLRGDGDPTTANINLSNLNFNVHVQSYAVWEVGGHGTSNYNNSEGCATVKVMWDSASGKTYVRPHSGNASDRVWYSDVKPKKDGFDITLHFIKEQVISSRITTSPCNGDPIIVDRKDDLTFDTFANAVIPLRFSNGQIVPGEITKTVVAMSGLQWDVSDYPLFTQNAYVKWDRFPGWLD